MAINSRQKGSKTERLVASLLTKWTGKKFARTPSSGGMQWKNSYTKGDVVCTVEGHVFPFCVEVKNHKDINFQHPLYLPSSNILTFWAQCKRDADLANKTPLLLMRYNGLPREMFFMVIEAEVFKLLKQTLKPEKYLTLNVGVSLVIMESKVLLGADYKKIKIKLKAWLKAKNNKR